MSNLYAAPAADMTPDPASDTYAPRLLQLNGRIGRVRFFVWTWLTSVSAIVAINLAVALLYKSAGFMMSMIGLLLWLPVCVVLVLITRRRLHDLGKSGWFALLQLIPFVNFIVGLWLHFGRGNEGPNQFGPAPAPNPRALIVAAWLLPVAIAVATPPYLAFENRMMLSAAQSSTDASWKEVDDVVNERARKNADDEANTDKDKDKVSESAGPNWATDK